MKLDTFAPNRIALHPFPTAPGQEKTADWFAPGFVSLFSLVVVFVFPNWSPQTIISLIVNAAVLVLGWTAWFGRPKTWQQPLGFTLLLVSLLLPGLPFPADNPFGFFGYPVFQNLFTWFPAFFVLLLSAQRQNAKLAEAIQFWAPLVYLVGINVFFVVLDFRDLPAFDSSRHIMNALAIYDAATGEAPEKFWQIITYYDFYQPISYMAATPFFMVFGKSVTAANLSQCLFWLPMAYIGGYKTLRYLRFTPGTAALSVFLCLAGTMSFSLLRHYMQDFAVLTMVVWFQYFVIRSHFLKRKEYCLKAGLSLGAGILTKASFLFFTPGIVAVAIIAAWKNRAIPPLTRIQNLLLFVVPVVTLTGFWFLVNQAHYSYTLPSMRNFALVNHIPGAEKMASWFWYWPVIPHLAGLAVFLCAVTGTALSFLKKPFLKPVVLYGLLSIVAAVAFLELIPNKDARTIFPLIGLMLIPVAFFFSSIPNKIAFPLSMLVVGGYLLSGFSQTFDWQSPAWLRPQPYSVFSKPQAPNMPTPNLSYFTYNRMMKTCFMEKEPPRLLFHENDNYHSRHAFQYLLPENKNVAPRQRVAGETILFTRSKLWPDHHLWSLRYQDSVVVLQQLCKNQQIDGDLAVELVWLDADEKAIQQEVKNLDEEAGEWRFTPVAGASKVRYGLKMHYTHPRGQWAQMAYILLNKESEYQPFNIPLQIFGQGVEPVDTQVLPFR